MTKNGKLFLIKIMAAKSFHAMLTLRFKKRRVKHLFRTKLLKLCMLKRIKKTPE